MPRVENDVKFSTSSSSTSHRRPSNNSNRGGGAIGRINRNLASTDEFESAVDEETASSYDHHQYLDSEYHSPLLGDDISRTGARRPSASSYQSSTGSNSSKLRRSSNTTSPRPHSASRSKILASSAQSLETSTVLPHDYRVRSNSGHRDRNMMVDTSVGRIPVSPMSINTRLPPSPRTTTRVPPSPRTVNRADRGSNGSSSTVPVRDVAADRHERFTSALGINKLQHAEVAEASTTPQRAANSRANPSSPIKMSPESQSGASFTKDKGEDDKKPSLRSRLFGLRKTPKEEDISDAMSIASTTASTDYGKEAKTSPTQPRDSPPMLRTTERKSSRQAVPTSSNDLLSPDSAGGAVRPKMDRMGSKGSELSRETNSSWITSLSNVSPPNMPEYDTLRVSPFSMGDESPVSPVSSLFRTTSWPASADRKGSFVTVQGGSGKGYRFENAAASQTKLSPSVSPSLDTVNKILESPTSVRETPSTSSSQITSPSTEPPSNNIPAFLKFDPSPNQTPPPAERREKSRAIISRMGSPPSADSESMDMGRRLRAHMRSDSSSSIRSTSSNRIPHARLKSHENSNRRSHWRNSSAISLSYQDGQMEAVLDQKRENRRSATVIGVVEAQNASPITIPTGPHHMPSSSSASSLQSPSRFAAMQGHPPVSARRGLYGSPPSPVMPRTSSLHGHTNPSLAGTSRTSSATNASFASAGSPVGVVNESLADEDQSSLPTSDIPIQGRGAVAESTSVAAILAKLSQLGDGEKDQESKGDLTTLSSVDTVSESISRDSEMDRTMTAEAPRMPEQKRVQQLSEEPKRPMKSPLRKISATTVNSLASTPSSVPLSPAKTVFGSDRPATVSSLAQSDSTRSIETSVNRIARKFDPSPPRHSLDDVAQLRALADSHFATLSTSRSRESATNEPVQVQPVPQSAKRLVDVTGSLERRDNLLPNESTNSLVTIQDRTDDLVTNASNMSLATEEDVNSESPADENTATRKTKMPVLATAFSRSGPGSRTASLIEQGTEDEAEDGSPSTISAKRKNKKWPFHSKDSPHEVTEMDRRVPSMGAKMANSLRGRKSESQSSSKLMIRRVYDETRLDEGQDEPMRVTSSDTTIVHSPAVPASAFFKERRDTDASLFSIDSGPNTPVMAHEEMTPEVKKLVHRRNVIRELVETEKSYSSDLAVVRDIYLARAKSVVGLSIASSLQTPLSGHSGHGTPTGTPTSLSNLGSRSSPLHTVHRNLQRMASSELKPPPSPPTGQSHPKASPSSSSEPSNRSSTYTVSSQTSQASDSSFPFNASSAPPLPATPPNLAKLNSTPSGNTLHAPSPSSITSASTVSGARNPSNKPKMQVSTTSLPQYQSSPIQTANDIGFTVTDLRVMFSHLEACCAFSEDMSSVLAGCMGTFARSKRLDSADVTVDMDKEDDRLGETFLQLMPRIRKVYINYCSRHEAGMLRLQEILAASPKASAIFKESTELARKHTNAWDLASLLIKPVQRVLKYPLLIQQILNGTAKTHPDYAQLSLAFEEIQAVADEINHVKRRKDLAETLIIGRTKEPKGVMASTSTMKGKKKLDISTDDGLLTPLGGEDSALEEYAELVKDFHTLADYVSRFSSQCTTWTRSLRESHESQISVMRGVRRLYRLQVEEVGQDGVTRAKENKESIKGEERLTAKYTKLLQTLLAESCRQIDRSVRLNILPRIVQIADLFEAPQTVMAKRDERQADYQRYRLNLLGGRQSDRKVMENANGFIALNAQLVEELPLFLQGVRTLLEATVYSFARLQAAHFQEVRNQTLTYWRDVAKKSDEVEVDKDTGVIKLKTINSVRVFWNRHSVSAAWVDSLGIVRRNVGMIVEDGNNSTGSASTTPAMTSTARMPSGSHPIESSEAKVSVADAMMKKSVNGDLPSSEMNDYHMPYNSVQAQRAMQARRPTVVGNLMRTISGTFAKDQDGEVIPPLPAGAGSRQVSTSSAKFNSPAPMLPNLTFKDKEGESGYFVQSGPVPFLDTISKQPYESSSPANDEISRSLSSYEEATSRSSQLHGRNDSIMSSISIQAVDPKQALPAEESGDTPRRQRMNVLYVCVAIADSQQELQGRTHLGWPFIPFVKNDTLRVLSSSDSAATPLLFGRIDRTGETGWAEKRCF